MMAGQVSGADGACQFGHGVRGFTTNFVHSSTRGARDLGVCVVARNRLATGQYKKLHKTKYPKLHHRPSGHLKSTAQLSSPSPPRPVAHLSALPVVWSQSHSFRFQDPPPPPKKPGAWPSSLVVNTTTRNRVVMGSSPNWVTPSAKRTLRSRVHFPERP